MLSNKFGRVLAILAAVSALGSTARADEIVKFTNGAEMTVRSHVVEKEMLKLDLGGNSSISFPISMVDKIVSAGQDVFVNPVYHPANQGVAGAGGGAASAPRSTGSIIADTMIRGGGPPAGLVRQASPGRAGVLLGEAADQLPPDANVGSGLKQVGTNPRAARFGTPNRPTYDPIRPLPPGATASLPPPNSQVRTPPPQISFRPEEIPNSPGAPPGANRGPQQPPPPADGSGAENQGDSGSQDDGSNGDDPPAQDPPQNN